MDKPVKFRVRSQRTGNMVSGYLASWDDERFYIDLEHVYAETISQYVGLEDQNGIEICEGDIVLVSFGSGEKNTMIRVLIEDIRNIPEDMFWGDEILIIGNMYDNPELAEGAYK